MKRNILARRAASAALAACMMFSLSAPALAASTDALLQQSTAAKSAVSVLDEENGMTEEPVYDEMDLNRGSITVYIGDDGKQYAKQGENDPQKRGNLQITTDGGRTENTITIEGGTTGAKVSARKGVSFDALATFDACGYKERQYDLLADVVRGGLDMSFVYRVLRREV